jgi:hypothetical protein
VIPSPPSGQDPANPRTQSAFLLSCALGGLGVLLIVTGLIVGGEVIFVLGTAAGALSLLAALTWRGELITAWRRDHPSTAKRSLR